MDLYSSKASKATKVSMMIKASFRPGDAVLVGILVSDFFGSIAATIIHLTMVFWVLDQGANDIVFTLLVLAIFIPLNVGVLLSGIAVNRIGARRLLVFSKSVAVLGAFVCYLLLAANAMTLLSLALIAAITYFAMGPSVSADVSRVPSLVRLAQRNLASYHAANSIVLVLGSIIGLLLAGYFADQASPDTATGLGVFLVIISTLITWLSFPKDNLLPRPQQRILFSLQRKI